MTRRPLLRLLLLAGAIGVGALLFRAAPRDVELVYDVRGIPGATGLEVEVRRGAELMRRAELRVPAGQALVHHPVRLPDGAYRLDIRVESPEGAVAIERPLEVREAGTVVLPLGR
ncbi:hypothetical protein [Anaeromyxobacter sp. PSR-1]|uniref:hypothetical protein n=1 Tax=unclassified Anaeromyxobacter TaxID=2620896 RepID=UPI0005E5110A|nr:hypothetical protein [Anaeromyxobacter sp. PSR-1]GAO04769.1 hypothetical protein PSR1_03665 [Anaeromyxobacter sp. PSR-1]